MKRILLAYSGDLASSVAIAWLRQTHEAEVVTVTVDIGQGPDLAVVRERALELGAARAHVIDAREELARDYLLPALQAGVFAGDAAPSLAIARALIARRVVDVAHMEAVSIVAHGAGRGSRTHLLLERTIRSLDPALDVLATTELSGLSEAGLVGFARAAGVHVPPSAETWVDANLWARAIGAPGGDPDEEAYLLTRTVEESPSHPATLDLEFSNGAPVRTNGVEMALNELIESVETIAGAHGVGRARPAEAPFVIESPAAAVLAAAHAALERVALGSDLAELKRQMAGACAAHIDEGRWFDESRMAIGAFVGVLQQRVNGTVRLRLLRGAVEVIEVHAPNGASRTTSPKAVA